MSHSKVKICLPPTPTLILAIYSNTVARNLGSCLLPPPLFKKTKIFLFYPITEPLLSTKTGRLPKKRSPFQWSLQERNDHQEFRDRSQRQKNMSIYVGIRQVDSRSTSLQLSNRHGQVTSSECLSFLIYRKNRGDDSTCPIIRILQLLHVLSTQERCNKWFLNKIRMSFKIPLPCIHF